jgi:hypothetical protein
MAPRLGSATTGRLAEPELRLSALPTALFGLLGVETVGVRDVASAEAGATSRAMGGNLTVDRTEGASNTFTLTLQRVTLA